MLLHLLNIFYVKVNVDMTYVSKSIPYHFIYHHLSKVIDAKRGGFILYISLCFYTITFLYVEESRLNGSPSMIIFEMKCKDYDICLCFTCLSLQA